MGSLHDERMRRFVKAGLYVVTSRQFSAGRATADVVRAVLAAGVRLIQLREKTMTKPELTVLAREVRRLTEARGALLIVNDHPDVALAVGADGVHLGQEDLPVDEARRMAPDLVIGASTHTAEQAATAQRMGASYVNVGPLFPTHTKETAVEWLGIEGLRRICSGISIPFTVMGGIKKHHIRELAAAGARTIAVVSAVTAADDPETAARELLDAIRDARRDRVSQ